MKKKAIGIIIAALCGCAILTGCNKTMFDTEYTFDKAVINLGDKTITVSVDKWNDYDGEQLQIITKDGTVILTSSYNCILLKTDSDEDIIGQFTED